MTTINPRFHPHAVATKSAASTFRPDTWGSDQNFRCAFIDWRPHLGTTRYDIHYSSTLDIPEKPQPQKRKRRQTKGPAPH